MSDAAGEEATCSDTEWDIGAGFGREGVLMGEGSGAGAAGGTRGARSSWEHAALPKHLHWQTAAREGSHLGKKCRSRLRDRERRLGTWVHRKGLSSQLAAPLLARCSFGGEDEQSRAGGHHAGGLPRTVLLPQGPRDRDWEIKKCSERKCSAMGGVGKLPPRAKNEVLGLFSACERRCGGDLLSASAYLHGEKPDCTHLINFF